VGPGAGACRPSALQRVGGSFCYMKPGCVTLPVLNLAYFSTLALITATASLYSANNQSFPFLFLLSGADVADGLDDAMSPTISRLTIILLLFLPFFLLSPNTRAQLPPAIPLAVRSPYLNCWLHNATLGQAWPTTFSHSQVCHP
jgi:hypothetical protein